MANDEHLRILRKGAVAFNEWRRENPGIQLDLINAYLSRADLSGANLSWGHLNDANLYSVTLISADLTGAKLRGATLSNADLITAKLISADLTGAHLSNVNLNHADLSRAHLSGANISGATIGWTIFADNDLSEVIGLESVKHGGPSTIGIDTLYKSGGKIPASFLRSCGVPDEFITYIPSHIGAQQAIQFYSCFISHSAKDQRFCERLYADLRANNVRVWYFPEDAKWGETVWGEIDKTIRIYDKLVVVCSENSLQSGPVLREIQRALNREDREGRNVLFPLRIDDYIFKDWQHERKDDVLGKVVGSFVGWQGSNTQYEEAFKKLLCALQAS
jgi:uncharacterized protein YjbI with pentapeptide repeats